MRRGAAMVVAGLCGVTFTAAAPGALAAKSSAASVPERIATGLRFGELVRAASAAMKGKRYDEVIHQATAALALNPDPKNAAIFHTLRAEAYVWKHDVGHAQPDAEAAVRLDPNLAAAHFELGLIYRMREQNEAAVAEDTKAIKLQPNWPQAYSNRGVAYDHLRKTDLAIRDYTEALRLNPNHVDAYVNRGGSYVLRGELRRALADFNDALRRDPKVENAHYNRALVWSRLREDRKALEDLNVAAQQEPLDPAILCSRAAVYRKLNMNGRALADYRASLALPLARSQDYAVRGDAFFALGEYAQAATEYRAAKARYPNSPLTLGSDAWFKATCPDSSYRNAREALAEARRACELSAWSDGGQLDTLAAAYAEAGNFEEAVARQKEAIKLLGGTPTEEVEKHLRAYEAQRPYRDEPLR